MRLTRSRAILTVLVLLTAFDTAGCADPGDTAPGGPEAAAPAGRVDLGEFVAHLSPRNRTLTFERITRAKGSGSPGSTPHSTPQSVDEITIAQDDIAGSGTANTVELVTNSVGTNGECPS